jgi:putative component of membrane protein insertase Oxa1/YidC/SpoIIIJ protein YidD
MSGPPRPTRTGPRALASAAHGPPAAPWRLLRAARLPRAAAALLALALLAALAPQRAAAQVRPHPFPPEAGRANPMRAPGLLSGPRLPLGSHPHTGYLAFVRRPVESAPQPLLLAPLAFYRRVVSPVNGSNSDLAPVPSLYAVQAVHEYGALLGGVLTAERLLHEPSAIPGAPRFREDGREFFYDPLAWNTYWLPVWLRAPAAAR